jgi:Tol biopolymer transport system component
MLLCTCAAQAQQISNRDIPSGATAKRPVTVTDAVEMTKIGEDEYLRLWDNSGNVAHFSPDGSKFVFITQKGDLKRDVIAYSIWAFDTATAVKSPKAQLVAKLESSSNRPAVANVKWLPDNNTLAFLGEQPGENPQVYKLTCNSKKLEQLTSQATPITNFSMSSDGEAFAYLADTEKDPVFSDDERRRGFVVPPRHQWQGMGLAARVVCQDSNDAGGCKGRRR